MEPLEITNAALKARGVKGRIIEQKERLFLRGTFTDSAGVRKDRKIPLGVSASGLVEAENRAVALAGIVKSTGMLPRPLPWEGTVAPVHHGVAPGQTTVADAVEQLECDFWQGKVRTSAAERTWARLKAETDRLPQDSALTMDLLVSTAANTKAGSRTRLESVKVLKRLAVLVGITGTERLDSLRTPYEPEVRDVPDNAAVAALLERVIDNPTWGWCTWALATFGCRPAEVFSLRPAGDGTAKVLTVKRKGKLPTWRTALALPVATPPGGRQVPWDVTAPAEYDSAEAKRHSDRWSSWLRRQHPTIQLYDLRHAWAIRSISKNLNASLAAKCMGHDIAVHHRTYHRWIDQADIAAVAASLN